ncbi:hypothetical protein [Bradyrhizobium erythrophlei]|uniref:Uncharacterized protein n=1 Tax=Bradyrhizobium erythrophlei TaxID=1437360 RepID=A0A1M5SJ91_9BRAD|nr:hypothetical protein [Bradyrhizobium erythrophlei]SHH38470.1 hypothetical protein SAMN05443248_4626 [Bradyrhizobium erythrophlei]
MSARKGIAAPDRQSSVELISISDERWARISSCLPETLLADKLRRPVLSCCSVYLTNRSAIERAAATAAAVRRPGKRQLAHLEQLAESLRKAANAWTKLDRRIYDDRLSEIRRFDELETLAADAERRLRGIHQLGKPTDLQNPWPLFVHSVAECCRRVGLTPTATGAGYDERRSKPSWFQEFIIAINDNLLGDQGGRRHSKAAQCAEIAKALRVTRSRAKP